MLSDPRSIAFVVECINPQIRHTPQRIQRLYSTMIGDPLLVYNNLNLVAGGARMTTVHGPASIPGATSHSTLVIAPDRVQLTEEWPSLTLDDFLDKASAAVAVVMKELEIATFPVTQCVTRCLVSVQGLADSREFFNQYFFRMDEEAVARLGRDVNLFGLRLAFPATSEDPSLFNVRIESFNNDVQSMFLEASGVFPTPFQADDLSPFQAAYRSTYDFLTRNVTDYLRGLEVEGPM